jgi:hypothetical protein
MEKTLAELAELAATLPYWQCDSPRWLILTHIGGLEFDSRFQVNRRFSSTK